MACLSRTSDSGEIWYFELRMQERNKSTGSPASFVRLSANIRSVGTRRTCIKQFRMLSRIMVMSMLVLRSSTAVGLDGEAKWSHKDLQSVTKLGDLRLRTPHACLTQKVHQLVQQQAASSIPRFQTQLTWLVTLQLKLKTQLWTSENFSRRQGSIGPSVHSLSIVPRFVHKC